MLHGVNFEVRGGEIVALLGRNGPGRSSTVKAIMGQVDGTGSVRETGAEVRGKAGIGYVPKKRDIFRSAIELRPACSAEASSKC